MISLSNAGSLITGLDACVDKFSKRIGALTCLHPDLISQMHNITEFILCSKTNPSIENAEQPTRK